MVFGDLNFPNHKNPLKRETVEEKTKWIYMFSLEVNGSEICHLLELPTKVVCVCMYTLILIAKNNIFYKIIWIFKEIMHILITTSFNNMAS